MAFYNPTWIATTSSTLNLYLSSNFNGLQVNGGGVFDRDFIKSLIIRDFDDVLKILLDVSIFFY